MAHSRESFLPSSKRPLPEKRIFKDQLLEDHIEKVLSKIRDPHFASLFHSAFFCNLDFNVNFSSQNGMPFTQMITKGGKNLWLKESTQQLWLYLPWCRQPSIHLLFEGLLRNQSQFILSNWPLADGWPNKSFDPSLHQISSLRKNPNYISKAQPKLSIEGLCYFVRLSFHFWKEVNYETKFDEKWQEVIYLIYAHFNNIVLNFESLQEFGDTSQKIGESIEVPQYLFVKECLNYILEILTHIHYGRLPIGEFNASSSGLNLAKQEYFKSFNESKYIILPFEVDGNGNQVFWEDGLNLGLLDLPYLGIISSENFDFTATRKFIFSKKNPYFFTGTYGEGIGSSSLNLGEIAVKSLINRALISSNDDEIWENIKNLVRIYGDLGGLSKSFFVYSEPEKLLEVYPPINSLFSELVLKIYHERPYLLAQKI